MQRLRGFPQRVFNYSHGLTLGTVLLAVLMAGGCATFPVHRTGAAVARLRRVSPQLWVGGQPTQEGLAQLKALGVQTVISVRSAAAAEASACAREGLRFVALPLSWHGAPDHQQSLEILQTIRAAAAAHETVFLHCYRGRDRTGAIVALYRLAHDGWTVDHALAEAHAAGLTAVTWSLHHWLLDMRALLDVTLPAGVVDAVPASAAAPAQDIAEPPLAHLQALEPLTFHELLELSKDPFPAGPIREKYNNLWTRPLISNAAYDNSVQPHRPTHPALGPILRVVTWNIELSQHIDEAIAAFTDETAFAALLDDHRAQPASRARRRALQERRLLEAADVVILQEMDIGMKRSGYRDAARDLAEALQMNYAYIPEYVEIDPVLLGTETIRFANGQQDADATTYYAVDPARYRGLFGLAVLSRYPIVAVEGFRLFNQTYDWYWQEQQKTSYLERLRRFGAKYVLHETPHREMKVGGRSYFRVDLRVPGLPEQRVSVINVHLEIKCTPEARAKQMAEILNYIKGIPHPVILAGDFNSAPQDLSPTSTPRVIQRSLEAPEFWINRGLEYLVPPALLLDLARFVSNATKNYQNPTAVHIPLIAPNPSAELFRLIERFRFSDGGAFDFRGDRGRSAGRVGTLSNANERDRWAYKITFRVDRTVAQCIGKYRLDWVFVKAYLQQPRQRAGPYRFAPHFGRTLNALNQFLRVRISDHDPNVVDLPLEEPPQ